MQRLKLIDISKWDGQPADPDAIKAAGYEGVLIRASYGLVRDQLFNYYWSIFKGKLKRFAYHYFMPAYDWKAQANLFYSSFTLDKPEGILMLDVEETGGIIPVSNIFNAAHSFCQYIDTILPLKLPAGIYTGRWFWEAQGGSNQTWVVSENRALWSASYPYDARTDAKAYVRVMEPKIVDGSALATPIIVKPWNIVTIWQWSAKGSVPGIVAQDVDLDVSIKDRLEFYAMMGWIEQAEVIPYEELVYEFEELKAWAISMGYGG